MKERLENLRLKKQWTWAKLAEVLDLSESMLYQVSAGKKGLSARAAYRLRQAELEAGIKSEPLAEFIDDSAEQTQSRGVNKSTSRVLLQPAEGEKMYSLQEESGGRLIEKELVEALAALELLKVSDPPAYKHMIDTIMFHRNRLAHKIPPPKKKPSSKTADAEAKLLKKNAASVSGEPPKS